MKVVLVDPKTGKITEGQKLDSASTPVCPVCSAPCDGFTATVQDKKPKDNDIALCIFCASVNRYKVNGTTVNLVAVSDKEIQQFSKEDPKFFNKLMEMVTMVKNKLIFRRT